MIRFHPWLFLLAALVSMCGCAQDAAKAKAAQEAWIGDVRDGVASARDITSKLGEPTETYGDGRILVYRLLLTSGSDIEGSFPYVMHGSNPIDERRLADHDEWDFVAVIDEHGIMLRHNMLSTIYVLGARYRLSPEEFNPTQPPVSGDAEAAK